MRGDHLSAIEEYLRKNPEGGSLKEIAQKTNGSTQNTHYHLVRMKRKGEVIRVKRTEPNAKQRRGQKPYVWKINKSTRNTD